MSVMNSFKPIALPPISSIFREVEVLEKLNSISATTSSASNFTPNSFNNYIHISNNLKQLDSFGSIPSVLLPSLSQDTTSASYITEQQRIQLQQNYNVARSDSSSLSRSPSFSSQGSSLSYPSIHQDQSPLTSVHTLSRDSTPSLHIPLQEKKTSSTLENQQIPEADEVDELKGLSVDQILKDSKTPRKYKCKTCEKFFTTSGHLARHSRIHTGERKHVCPFPDCNARFARHDNCMQHFRTHRNPKTRKRRLPRA